jgi:hypothetical protein
MTQSDQRRGRRRPLTEILTIPGLYLIVFAACGWLILIANMFGVAGRAGWIVPVVDDIPGLAASTVVLAVLGLTPMALRQLLALKGKSPQ